jgi:preprotein translocase subunit SecA
MNQQRNLIYKQRNDVLNGENISETIQKMILATVSENVATYMQGDDASHWDFAGLREVYRGILTTDDDFQYADSDFKRLKRDDISEMLCDRAIKLYNEKVETVGEERFRELERAILLQNVDRNWMEHIDAMDDLKGSIRMQSYAQRDPVTEYRLQGADMFDEMISDIRERTARMILSVTIQTPEVKRVQLANPINEGFEGMNGEKVKRVTVAKRNAPAVGRNDLCPCGSGKKYKKCCGDPAKQ